MKKRNIKKLTACLLAFAMAFTATGCGNNIEQDIAADTAETEEMEANASDTVGSGTDVNMDLDTEETETSVPLKEALTITASYMESEPGRDILYVDIENTAEKDVTVEWLDLMMDGKAASEDSGSEFESWFPDLWSVEIEAGDTYQEMFYIDHPTVSYAEYAEAAIEATVSDSSKTQTEPLNITISLKDVEIVNAETTVKTSAIHIEEQELYNANSIVVTIPEQTISPSSMPTFHLECQYDHSLYYSFLDLKVDGDLIAEGSHSNADGEIDPAEPSDDPIPVDFWTAIDSGKDSGKITFVLFITEDQRNPFVEPEITIPYTIIEE